MAQANQSDNTPTQDEMLAYLNGQPESSAGSSANPADAPQEDALASEEQPDPSQVQPEESTEDAPEAGTESEEGKGTDKTEAQPKWTRQEKEHQRLGKGWQQLNADKEALRKEREAIAAERAEIEKQRGESARKQLQSPEPMRDERGFTAEEYEAAAEKWDKEGEDANAIKAARVAAQALRSREHQQVQTSYQEALNHAIRQNPDLQNPASPLARATLEIIQSAAKQKFNPYGDLDGYSRAVEHAKLRLKVDSVPALEKKITELNTEIQRLTKASSPQRGGPASLGKASNNGMPTRAEVLAALESAEAGR